MPVDRARTPFKFTPSSRALWLALGTVGHVLVSRRVVGMVLMRG